MWIKASGPLGANTYQYTTPVTTHLLATGAESALCDAGVLCFGNRLADKIEAIQYLFLSHAHFDHIGALPALRKRFPDLNAVGSRELNEIFRDDLYMREVYDHNQRIAESFALPLDESFDAWRGEEVFPGPGQLSRRALIEFIRRKAETIYHPVGTCHMGTGNEPDAVVDAELRVHGIEGLRVVDASVMPQIVSGNTNAPTIMIAERAADLLLGDGAPSKAKAAALQPA